MRNSFFFCFALLFNAQNSSIILTFFEIFFYIMQIIMFCFVFSIVIFFYKDYYYYFCFLLFNFFLLFCFFAFHKKKKFLFSFADVDHFSLMSERGKILKVFAYGTEGEGEREEGGKVLSRCFNFL